MRFLLDMGISPKTGAFLQKAGHNASHLQAQGLQRMADPNILEKARKEERVLLTHDLDFSDLLAASGARLPSVVLFRLKNMRPENVNRHLQVVIDAHEYVLNRGAIFSVTEGQIRWRHLPLAPDE